MKRFISDINHSKRKRIFVIIEEIVLNKEEKNVELLNAIIEKIIHKGGEI